MLLLIEDASLFHALGMYNTHIPSSNYTKYILLFFLYQTNVLRAFPLISTIIASFHLAYPLIEWLDVRNSDTRDSPTAYVLIKEWIEWSILPDRVDGI